LQDNEACLRAGLVIPLQNLAQDVYYTATITTEIRDKVGDLTARVFLAGMAIRMSKYCSP
jgi:hypothetical protein